MDTNNYESQWQQAIPGELIYSNQVHIWRACLDLAEPQMKGILEILSTDEVQRAGRFRFEKDKKRFIAARGILRQILAGYLKMTAQQLRFEYTSFGKPVLAKNSDFDNIYFNLSHSDAYALYAFTRHRNVGIDIELIRNDAAVYQIAQKFFSPGEVSSLESTNKNKLHDIFFQYWTRKEAIVKAKGEGISSPLEKVNVSLIDGKVLSPVLLPGDGNENRSWYVKDLFPCAGYVAAIAVEGDCCDLSFLHYSL
ncbi:MAG: 4'-phosphopantetheinyl transferase superfamily protein [Bacteroidota bacterium]